MISTRTPTINSKKDTNSHDLTGLKVHYLTVIKKTDKRSASSVVWECLCDCGKTHYAKSFLLKHGKIKSCGCKTNEILSIARTKHGGTNLNGPLRYTYVAWLSMIQRCFYEKHKSYSVYGGAGIKVCDRWRSFETFLSDMGVRPKNKTIGRIDHKQSYEPSNCQWETLKEQANNKKNNVFIDHNGKRLTVSQWADKTGIARDTLSFRLKKGWGIARSLETPLKVITSNRVCMKNKEAKNA